MIKIFCSNVSLLFTVAFLLFYSCKEKLGTSYRVKERFEIIDGEYTGTKGENEFTIKVSASADNIDEIYLDNFANAYKLRAIIKNDSIYFPTQKFQYHQSHVTIYGKGIILNDSVRFEYFSGGPQGQIICTSKGVKQ